MMDLYFNENYAKLYERIEGRSATFTHECAFGKIKNTFILRQIETEIDGQTYYDIVTPYGYGGPIIMECSDVQKLMDSYREAFSAYCRENRIICEFIRFHLYDNVDVREHYYGETVKMLDDVIVDTTGSYDEIYMRYEHKVRKNVKKARANGLEMRIEKSTAHLDDFLTIYYETMQRNHAKQYYYFEREYFENIEKLLPHNFIYFDVLKDGKAIATELVLYSEKYAYSFLGGTLEDYYPMRPNDFLKDAIIQWCNATGISVFVLGGGYHKDDGIYKYKRSFTPAPDVPFYVGKYIFDKEKYDYFVNARAAKDAVFDLAADYFPLYRA